MAYVLILGANSDMAKELALIYAKNGYNLYLANRDVIGLEKFANNIRIRTGVDVKLKEFDMTEFDSHKNFYNSLDPKPEGIIVAAGFMTDQADAQNEWDKTLNTINVNYTGAVSILNIAANDLVVSEDENPEKKFIIGISSVAGDRGRKTNYIYGSAKAAFSAYLSGLRNRLFEHNIQVLTVKPGFVDTKMTHGLDLPQKLTASTKEVASDIFSAQQKNKNIIYTKSIWYFIMLIIKHIPETIFKRLSI